MSGYIVNKCANDDEAVEALYDLLKESIDGWGFESIVFATDSSNEQIIVTTIQQLSSNESTQDNSS